MKRIAILAASAALATLPFAAMAANARNPYGNVDHRVDAGNDTGDSRVEALNQQQLNRNAAPGPYGRVLPGYPPPRYAVPAYPPAAYAPGYYAPPVVVAPYRYYRPYRYAYPY